MGVDYYNLLKVNRNATDDDLRKAYKRLAMKWHPDKNLVNREEAEAKFKLVCEAYDVLSHPQKRWIYHQYGEEGLKNGAAPQSPSFGGSRPDSSTFNFNRRNPEDIFSEFFTGTDRSKSTGRIFRENKRDSSRHASDRNQSNSSNKAPPVENKLPCTLEELYKGARRKMRISRVVPDEFGNPKKVEETLKFDIQPGWKKGTKITFPEKGDFVPGFTTPDLIFVIDEKPHSVFKRDGNDLVTNQTVTLLEALTGKTINLTTLDGRTLVINVSDIIRPDHEVVVSNEGMPKSKDPRKKGNLRILFDITFPLELSSEQKSDLTRVLG